jgi:hypothetical protein
LRVGLSIGIGVRRPKLLVPYSFATPTTLVSIVGSQFVLIIRNGRRTLVNISQIASLWVEDIDLSSDQNNIMYRDVDPAIGMVYSLEVLMTSRRELYFQFPNAADRDAVYEQLLAAISPAIIIESTGPSTLKIPGQKWSHFPKPAFPNEIFATEQEYDRALVDAVTNLMILKMPPVQASEPTTPPNFKPPRKPYTRKPRK